MSGHSKWSTIKHKKAATDAKRGKLFTRLAKEITIASRESGGDPVTNTRLRLAIDKAKGANMPKDSIERAVKRGTGELAGSELYEVVYEAYAQHGIGMLIEVVTDNKNRTVAEVRHLLNKHGGNLAEAGSVSWQFTRKGYIGIVGDVDEDGIFMAAVDAGADDVQFGEVTEIFTDLDDFQAVQKGLEDAGIKMEEANVIYDPNSPLALDHEEALQVMTLVEKLEELDDVQNVFSSLEITDEAIAAMAG